MVKSEVHCFAFSIAALIPIPKNYRLQLEPIKNTAATDRQLTRNPPETQVQPLMFFVYVVCNQILDLWVVGNKNHTLWVCLPSLAAENTQTGFEIKFKVQLNTCCTSGLVHGDITVGGVATGTFTEYDLI